MNVQPETVRLISGLPGEEFVLPGLRDLEAGVRSSPEALLILIAKSRLVRAGLTGLAEVNSPEESAESLLYRHLQTVEPESAYGKYNSMKKRLDSFIRCLEQRQSKGQSCQP